jgi:hypothetical protein
MLDVGAEDDADEELDPTVEVNCTTVEFDPAPDSVGNTVDTKLDPVLGDCEDTTIVELGLELDSDIENNVENTPDVLLNDGVVFILPELNTVLNEVEDIVVKLVAAFDIVETALDDELNALLEDCSKVCVDEFVMVLGCVEDTGLEIGSVLDSVEDTIFVLDAMLGCRVNRVGVEVDPELSCDTKDPVDNELDPKPKD